ncbi:MAG: hypothetical protein CSA68_02495 [Rhodobacterales bacterium]|nr:MAG: hypothetical protein CSA68_02495 [Rhodobacterales bacterium]
MSDKAQSGSDPERALASRSRRLFVVICSALGLWVVARLAGISYQAMPVTNTLLNLILLAAFFWCMIVSYQIRRTRRALRKKTKKL